MLPALVFAIFFSSEKLPTGQPLEIEIENSGKSEWKIVAARAKVRDVKGIFEVRVVQDFEVEATAVRGNQWILEDIRPTQADDPSNATNFKIASERCHANYSFVLLDWQLPTKIKITLPENCLIESPSKKNRKLKN